VGEKHLISFVSKRLYALTGNGLERLQIARGNMVSNEEIMGTSSDFLISNEQMAEYKALSGRDFPKNRRTGRSTAIGLSRIADAIENPGKDILIRDHLGTPQADKYLMRMILDMISKLDLRGFHYKKAENMLSFQLHEK
jgi:hypothetical protein